MPLHTNNQRGPDNVTARCPDMGAWSRGGPGRGAAPCAFWVMELGWVGEGADVSRWDVFPVGLSVFPRLLSWP